VGNEEMATRRIGRGCSRRFAVGLAFASLPLPGSPPPRILIAGRSRQSLSVLAPVLALVLLVLARLPPLACVLALILALVLLVFGRFPVLALILSVIFPLLIALALNRI
jgi:hypothetical protein